MSYETIYLGPANRLMPIMIPTSGYDADLIEYGAFHDPLSGLATKDVFGHKRTFSIDMDALDQGSLSYLEMLFMGAIEPPFYLRDSRQNNLLKPRIASSMSYPFDPYATVPTYANPGSGTLTPTAVTPLVLPGPNGVFTPAPNRSCTWVPAAANVLTDNTKTPVVPGEQICFSAYVVSGTPLLELVLYSATGVVVSTITGTTTIAGTPPRYSVSTTIPADGTVASVAPQIRASAAGTYQTLAWQLNTGSTPTKWTLGTGVARVIFGTFPQHRERVGKYTSATITLREA